MKNLRVIHPPIAAVFAPEPGAGAGARERAENMLRQAQVRVTDARVGVLSMLLQSGRALSHLELQDTLTQLDRVTLYRALDCLTEAGLTHKIAGDDRVFRYSTGNESSPPAPAHGVQHQHGHFKCTRCARLFCLDDAQQSASLQQQLQVVLQNTLQRGFQNHDIEVTIKGWCADCST